MTLKVLGGPRKPEELCASGDFSKSDGTVTLHLDKDIIGTESTPHKCFELQVVEVGLYDQETHQSGLKLNLKELKFVHGVLGEAITELEE